RLDDQGLAIRLPLGGREVEKGFPRRRRDLAELRGHDGRGAAAEGPQVEGRQVGVAHDEPDSLEGHPQLLRHDLGQLGADVLAELDLAGEDGDGAVLSDVQPGADLSGEVSRLLSGRSLRDEEDEQAGAQELEEAAPLQLEAVGGPFEELVALGLYRVFHRPPTLTSPT